MGKHSIELILLPQQEEVLVQLHRERNELLSAVGKEQMTFEEWLGCMISFAGISSTITVAQAANQNTRKNLSNRRN